MVFTSGLWCNTELQEAVTVTHQFPCGVPNTSQHTFTPMKPQSPVGATAAEQNPHLSARFTAAGTKPSAVMNIKYLTDRLYPGKEF